jgi:small subunit ribosomal protein S11
MQQEDQKQDSKPAPKDAVKAEAIALKEGSKAPKKSKAEGAPKAPKASKASKEAGEPAASKEGDEAAVAAAPGAEGAATIRRKKTKKNVSTGNVFIQASFNNTIVTVTDQVGNVICWSTAGAKGFSGSRKNTPFAAQVAAEDAARKAMDNGMRTVQIFVSGPGAGRESALRAIQSTGLRVTLLKDITPIPHNGCRPPKRRRV